MSLTKEDLQAVATIVSQQLGIMQEQYFDPRFKLLADAIGEINEKMVTKDDQEAINVKLDAHEAVIKEHGRRIRALEQKAV